MRRLAALSAASVLSLLTAGTALAHSPALQGGSQQSEAGSRTSLGGGLYTIMGRGGNILFFTGEDGTFVVDDQFADNAAENLELITTVSDTPIVFVLNTHYHGDHTGGNEPFYDQGATLLAHENVRARLAEEDRSEDALPNITFSENATFYWNGDEISVHHVPAAHTDGDMVVKFRDANVIHTGDVVFFGRYPYIDLQAGGSVDGMLAAMARIEEMADGRTRIVPGHGPMTDRAGVRETMEMLEDAQGKIRALMMEGQDREAVIAADPLSEYNDRYAWEFISADRMVGQLYDDLMAHDSAAADAVARGPQTDASAQATEAADAEAGESGGGSSAAGVIERLKEGAEAAGEAIEGAAEDAGNAVERAVDNLRGEDEDAAADDTANDSETQE